MDDESDDDSGTGIGNNPTPDPNPQDEINPELIYALWELTAFTVNGRIETFDPLYLNFYRDNYMASGESTEVVNKPQPFEIIGDRIYVDDNVELGIRHYMTIQQLTESKLKFRSDLADGTITEYAFKKVYDIDYNYYPKSVAPKKFIFNLD